MGCYGVRGLDGGNNEANWIFCATNPSLVQNPNYASIGQNYVWVVDGSTPVFDQWWGMKPGASIISLPTQADVDSWLGGRGVGGSCSGCLLEPQTKYDCINGNCVPKTQYNTPGQYETLEACQAGCGGGNQTACPSPFQCLDPNNYCPPGKVCIPNSEWSQIESLAAQLRNKDCS